MPTDIDRHEVKRLMDSGAQVVEVLPASEYEDDHLPGALNLPLTQLDEPRAPARLDRDRPVVVYCFDGQSDLSARAAWRLEAMGYGPVYRYAAGKVDWSAAGWPREGKLSEGPFAGDVARRDVPVCRPDETVATARARAEAAGWDRCVVVGEGDVVLGLLSGPRLAADGRLAADLAMQPGPHTFRTSLPVAERAERMEKNTTHDVLITTADGVLVGALDRRTTEEAADGRAHH